MQDMIAVKQMAEEQQRVAKEHAEVMALIAAAQAEEIKQRASELHEQMERHQVPQEYLTNDELFTALREAKEAVDTDVAPEADRAVAERMHLIEKDGVDGPSIDDLRTEVGQDYSGVEDSHFADAKFVAAARDWHEAKTLAEGGFAEKGSTGLQGRYENAEKELFTHLAPMGKDIEDKVMADQRTESSAPRAEAAPAPLTSRPGWQLPRAKEHIPTMLRRHQTRLRQPARPTPEPAWVGRRATKAPHASTVIFSRSCFDLIPLPCGGRTCGRVRVSGAADRRVDYAAEIGTSMPSLATTTLFLSM